MMASSQAFTRTNTANHGTLLAGLLAMSSKWIILRAIEGAGSRASDALAILRV